MWETCTIGDGVCWSILTPFFHYAPAAEASDEITKVTFRELSRDVALFAAAMRKIGVRTGDRVVGEYMLNWSSVGL